MSSHPQYIPVYLFLTLVGIVIAYGALIVVMMIITAPVVYFARWVNDRCLNHVVGAAWGHLWDWVNDWLRKWEWKP